MKSGKVRQTLSIGTKEARRREEGNISKTAGPKRPGSVVYLSDCAASRSCKIHRYTPIPHHCHPHPILAPSFSFHCPHHSVEGYPQLARSWLGHGRGKCRVDPSKTPVSLSKPRKNPTQKGLGKPRRNPKDWVNPPKTQPEQFR